jgi:hypothetical protein
MDEQFELITELLSWLLTPVLELVSRLPRFIRTSHMHLFTVSESDINRSVKKKGTFN